VLEKHSKNRLLGCWRLSLFLYQEQRLSHTTIWHTTIWRILVAARKPRLPSQAIYDLTHYHQIWFIDHMHLRTLPDGQKVYSLVIVDGMSRVILSDEVCLSKDARDAVMILLQVFALWGLPEEIVSDNEGKPYNSWASLGKWARRIPHWHVSVLYVSAHSTPENCFRNSAHIYGEDRLL